MTRPRLLALAALVAFVIVVPSVAVADSLPSPHLARPPKPTPKPAKQATVTAPVQPATPPDPGLTVSNPQVAWLGGGVAVLVAGSTGALFVIRRRNPGGRTGPDA